MTRDRPYGKVYKLIFDDKSGPPKKRWRFILEDAEGKQITFTYPTDCAIWCEVIIEEAHKKLRKQLGEVTIVPSKPVLKLFADWDKTLS